MIDLDTPVPTLPLCPTGHVACVGATFEGQTWCYGWHLVVWDPEWRTLVVEAGHIAWCVDRLAALLVGDGCDLTACEWFGFFPDERVDAG